MENLQTKLMTDTWVVATWEEMRYICGEKVRSRLIKSPTQRYRPKVVEPTEVQYLIISTLETLELLQWRLYDETTGSWHIQTPSPVLPLASILQSGDVVPFGWEL